MKHPADRIRTTTLMALVSLGLLAQDLLKIRRWAKEARDLERELRARHAREINDLDASHAERIAESAAQVAALRRDAEAAEAARTVTADDGPDAPPDAD